MNFPSLMNRTRGSTELGMPLFIIAILGTIALPRFWGVLPLWGRIAAIAVIGGFVVAGFVFLGQPSGMATRAMEQELQQANRREHDRDDEAPPRSE